MSVNEFKAWFDGYTQAKKELTTDDIKIIREKLNEIQDQVQFVPITYPVYPTYPDPWIAKPYWQIDRPFYREYTDPYIYTTWDHELSTVGDTKDCQFEIMPVGEIGGGGS